MANNINELFNQHSDDPLFVSEFKTPADLEKYLQDPNNVKEFKQVYGPALDETQLTGLKKKEDTFSSSSASVGVEPMVETPPMGVQDNSEVLGTEAQGIDLSGQPLPELGYGKGIPLPDPAKQKYVDGEILKIQKFLEGNNPGAAFSQLRQLKQQNPDLKLTPEQNATLAAPLNKYLESRKAQPGSANLIKTITKDASDLGLTLETVKPELTPQQKAVSTAVKQIPAEKLKTDNQPVSENIVGDMKGITDEVNLDMWNNFAAEGASWLASTFRIPEFAYALNKNVLNPEQAATIMLTLEPLMNSIKENNIPAEFLEKQSEEIKSKMQQVEGTIAERFAAGDYANGFAMIGNSVAGSAPATFGVMLTGGGAAGLTLMGLSSAVAKKEQLDKQSKEGKLDITETQKYINSVATGTAEALFESIGIGSLARASKSIFAREGVDAGREILKKGILDNFDNLVKKYPVLLGPLAEGSGEWATAIAQNAADKYTGVDPERNLFEGATDALIVGTAMGGGFGAVLKGAQVVLPKLQRSKIAENQDNIQRASELSQDPNITPEKKEALDNLAAKSSAENTKLEKEGLDKLNSIPEENRMEFSQLSEKAANIEDQIDTEQDPLIKKALESELTDTQTKIKEIENAVQKQTTSEVPVQPETSVGQEMVEGKPQAEPQVAPQEGQKEEVTEEPKFSKGVEAPVEDVVKTKKNEDNDHTVTLNGEEIGMMYYKSSQKTWVNANFDKSSEQPYSVKWIYGDMLGDTKQEAIDELVRRYKENKPEVLKQENKVEYSKDETLNTFLNALNNTNPLSVNPLRPREFIYNNKAALEFNRFDKGNRKEVELQDISVIEKGKGEGKAVMKDITDAADKSGITLTLEAKPFGQGGLNKKDLINFYKKNGFEVDWKDAYGGDFNSEQELIDYALENESEGVPMKRMPVQGTKFSKNEEGEVDNSDIEAIREEMNNMPEEKANFDVPSDLSTKNKLDVKSIAPKLKAKLKGLFKGGIIKNLTDWNGIPMTFTISDQLASEPVKNPLTGNTINTNGGLLFSLTKGNENSAWANTDENEAKKMLSRAQEVYGKNKEIYQRLWKEGTLPYGHIPMAIIKMGQDSILSNEALFRIGSDNIKAHFTPEERTNALEGLKEDVSAVDPNAKVLEFIDQNKFTAIDQLLDKMADLKPIGERKIVSRFLFTGGVALDKETKPGTPQSRTALALVGNKDASFNKYIHLQTLNNIIQEKATAKIPASHIIGIAGVDVLNLGLTKPKHSNYPDGVKGQLIGLVESPVHAADIFPEMYSKTFYLQKENKAGKPTSPKAAAEQAVAPSGFVASIKAFRGAKISTKMTELQKLLGKLKLAFPSVTIVDSAQEFDSALNNPDVKKFVKDGEVVYGFTKDGKVYLNPDKANANTAIHEFSHIWMNFLKQNNPALLKKGYDILEGTDLLKKKIKEFGNTELAREEAMAEAIANKGETLIEAGKQSKFKNWLNAVFSYVKEKFKAFDQYTPEELQDISLNQFIEGSLNAILSGKEVTAEDIKNFEVAFSKAAEPNDIKTFYDADIAAKVKPIEAMKNLLAKGFTEKQILDTLGETIPRATLRPYIGAAWSEMGQEAVLTYNEQVFNRVNQEITDYVRSNPKNAVELRKDLLNQGHKDVDIFRVMNLELFSDESMREAFGEEYRQTITNAIQDSRYPVQQMEEVTGDLKSIKIAESFIRENQNFVGFNLIDKIALVDFINKYLENSGYVDGVAELRKQLDKADTTEFPSLLLTFAQSASNAGRILQMARFFKQSMSDLLIGTIEKGRITISDVTKAKVKTLVDTYNQKNDAVAQAKKNFLENKDDASFQEVKKAQEEFYKAGQELMDLLDRLKIPFWNELWTAKATKSLLSLGTTVVSGYGNVEQGALGTLAGTFRSFSKTNRPVFKDWFAVQQVILGTSIRQTRDIITKGNFVTPEMASKYMDGMAYSSDIKAGVDAIKYLNDLIKKGTTTDQERAEKFDWLQVKGPDGKIELLDGRNYKIASNLFHAAFGVLPEITARALSLSGDRIAYNGYKTRGIIDYIRRVEREVAAGVRDTEVHKYIADELKGKVRKSDMDLLVALSMHSTDYSEFGQKEAMMRVFMDDNVATKFFGGTRSGLRKKIRNNFFKYLEAETTLDKVKYQLAKQGYQILDVGVWSLSPFTRVPLNVLIAAQQKTNPLVAAALAYKSSIDYTAALKDFNKAYGNNTIAEFDNPTKQKQYEKAKQELFEKERIHNYNTSALALSTVIATVIFDFVLSGALTPPAGSDKDEQSKRKGENLIGIGPGEINFTYYNEFCKLRAEIWLDKMLGADEKIIKAKQKKLDNFFITRDWIKGDKVMTYTNASQIGIGLGYISSLVYTHKKSKVEQSNILESMRDYLDISSSLSQMGESSIGQIGGLQNAGLLANIFNAPEGSHPVQDLVANELAATLSPLAPNIYNFYSKEQEQTQLSTGRIVPEMEDLNLGMLSRIFIKSFTKLSRNSQIYGDWAKSDYYRAGVGIFGEELKLNRTGFEPGTPEAFFGAMFNVFNYRSFKQVEQGDEKANYANSFYATVIRLARIAEEVGAVDKKGEPLNLYNVLVDKKANLPNSFNIGGATNISLPQDMYVKELQELGKVHFKVFKSYLPDISNPNNIGNIGTALLSIRNNPEDAATINKQLNTALLNIQTKMNESFQTYENVRKTQRDKKILMELNRRGLISESDKELIRKGYPQIFDKR